MAEAKYRVGVVGIGRAGTTRARAFDKHPLCQVTAIADTDPENLELGCRRFGARGVRCAKLAAQPRCSGLSVVAAVQPVMPVWTLRSS